MGSVQDLQESSQWEEEAHTDSALNLLDPTSATNTTDTRGLGVGGWGVAWGCSLHVEGTAQRLSPKQERHGRAEWKERPEF